VVNYERIWDGQTYIIRSYEVCMTFKVSAIRSASVASLKWRSGERRTRKEALMKIFMPGMPLSVVERRVPP
jgi:hypothetical protein